MHIIGPGEILCSLILTHVGRSANKGSLLLPLLWLSTQNGSTLSHKATNTFSSPRCWQFIRITISQIFLVFTRIAFVSYIPPMYSAMFVVNA